MEILAMEDILPNSSSQLYVILFPASFHDK